LKNDTTINLQTNQNKVSFADKQYSMSKGMAQRALEEREGFLAFTTDLNKKIELELSKEQTLTNKYKRYFE